jgi:hypothetical protein
MIEADTPPLALVRRLLAARLRLDEALLKDTDRLEDLGLTPLDVALVVLRLYRDNPGYGDFPVHLLRSARTVGHLAQLVELWSWLGMRNGPAIWQRKE